MLTVCRGAGHWLGEQEAACSQRQLRRQSVEASTSAGTLSCVALCSLVLFSGPLVLCLVSSAVMSSVLPDVSIPAVDGVYSFSGHQNLSIPIFCPYFFSHSLKRRKDISAVQG